VDCRLERNSFFTERRQVRRKPCSDALYLRGISLWNLWKARAKRALEASCRAADQGKPGGCPSYYHELEHLARTERSG
jgi:hypothetical protein